MNNFYLFKKFSKITFYLAVLFIATTIISCKKEEVTSTVTAAISVINTSPTFATYDAYLNSNKINSVALPFGGSTKYAQYEVGSYSLKFTTAGSTDDLLTKSVNLFQNTYYSYYLIGRPNNFDAILVADDLNVPAADKAYVRFINVSPDAPALDLAVTNGTTLVSNKAFKDVSGFIAVTPGTLSFDIKETTSGTIKTTLTDAVVTAGFHYTIITRGLNNPANNLEHNFSAQLIKHQ